MKSFFLIVCLSLSLILHAEEDHYVVVVHGFLSNHLSMKPIRKRLERAGMQVYAWNYPSDERTSCEHAYQLACILRDIAECRPGQPIDFVAHSVGGLILRRTLNLDECPPEAKKGRVVLIAPPNQGSCLARQYKNVPPVPWILGSKLGSELMNYDPCAIQAMGHFPENTSVLVIAGSRGNHLLFDEPNDGYLAVRETALETPCYFQDFHIGHGELLRNPCVGELIVYFLEDPKFQPKSSEEETLELTHDQEPEGSRSPSVTP